MVGLALAWAFLMSLAHFCNDLLGITRVLFADHAFAIGILEIDVRRIWKTQFGWACQRSVWILHHLHDGPGQLYEFPFTIV